MEWQIRRAVPHDAEQYSQVRLVAMEHAYADFMPSEFFASMRDQHRARVDEYRAAIAENDAARAAGGAAVFDHWVAIVDGEIVGVCTLSDGPREWELDLGVDDPPVWRQLASLYTVPRVHGTGIGQHLLDTALPSSEAAYLWVMADNPRAIRFYERNRFVAQPGEVSAGESWHLRPMWRMWRDSLG